MPTRRLSDPPPEKETPVEATDPGTTHNPPGDDVPGIVGAFGTAYGDSPTITEEPLMNEEDVVPTAIAPPHTSAIVPPDVPDVPPEEPPPTEEVPPEEVSE